MKTVFRKEHLGQFDKEVNYVDEVEFLSLWEQLFSESLNLQLPYLGTKCACQTWNISTGEQDKVMVMVCDV